MSNYKIQYKIIKDKLTNIVNDIIRPYMHDKIYEKDKAQK